MKVIFEKKKKPGLWANIHAKRKRGEKPAKPGEEGYPEKDQWDKLTKEELEKIISEELLNILEQEKTDLPTPEEQVKRAHELNVAAQKDLQSKKSTAKAISTDNPKLQQAQKTEIRAKQIEADFAKENERKAKESAAKQQSVPETVKEEKSNFQKYVAKKGKGWKVRLLTKGKQSAGSAYPQKAPTERAKSAPPGAGGV